MCTGRFVHQESADGSWFTEHLTRVIQKCRTKPGKRWDITANRFTTEWTAHARLSPLYVSFDETGASFLHMRNARHPGTTPPGSTSRQTALNPHKLEHKSGQQTRKDVAARLSTTIKQPPSSYFGLCPISRIPIPAQLSPAPAWPCIPGGVLCLSWSGEIPSPRGGAGGTPMRVHAVQSGAHRSASSARSPPSTCRHPSLYC